MGNITYNEVHYCTLNYLCLFCRCTKYQSKFTRGFKNFKIKYRRIFPRKNFEEKPKKVTKKRIEKVKITPQRKEIKSVKLNKKPKSPKKLVPKKTKSNKTQRKVPSKTKKNQKKGKKVIPQKKRKESYSSKKRKEKD